MARIPGTELPELPTERSELDEEEANQRALNTYWHERLSREDEPTPYRVRHHSLRA